MKITRSAFITVVVLLCAAVSQADVPGFMKARMGTLTGRIIVNDAGQVPGGLIVSFFDVANGPPPYEVGMRRVPEMVTRSDENGNFSVQLLPGKYNIGCLIRDRGAGPGPPRPGEKFFFVLNADKKFGTFEVPKRQIVNIGTVHGAPPTEISELKSYVTVEGVISDDSGKPVQGAFVLIKKDINIARPLFISKATDEQGRYSIKLPPNETFYLIAREQIQGGRPMPGSFVGTYGKTAPTQGTGQEGIGAPAGVSGRGGEGKAIAVNGKAGEVFRGVDITMFKVPDPQANREKFQQEAKEKKEVQEQAE